MTKSTAVQLAEFEARLETSLNRIGARFNTIEALLEKRAAGLTEAESEKAGQTIAEPLITAGEYLMAKLNGFDALLGKRLGHVLQALATYQAHLEQLQAGGLDPRAPPDPVRESELYQQLVGLGVDEDVAYAQAEKKLQGADPVKNPISPGGKPAAAAQPGTLPYPDDEEGRARRVWDILHGKPPRPEVWSKVMLVWRRIEEAENKHSVDGESTAFDLLYPAIVVAARAAAGKMPMWEFINEKAIKASRAPWDQASNSGAAAEELQMQAELATWLQALERANHPMAQTPARTSETEGGRTLIESTKQYHARVKRVYQQLQMLQQKGV